MSVKVEVTLRRYTEGITRHICRTGKSHNLVGSESSVLKGWPKHQDGMELSTVMDKDGNCRDLGEEDCIQFLAFGR